MQQPIIMTVDIGLYKSGFCLLDIEEGEPFEHGCIATGDTRGMISDLFAIAISRNATTIVFELSHHRDFHATKLRGLIEDIQTKYSINVAFCTAPEWRHSLHFHSRYKEREEYKELALDYVKNYYPEHYKNTMSDDEAEAICMGAAYLKGLYSLTTKKEKRNEAAKKKKNFHKHRELEDYEEYQHLYR